MAASLAQLIDWRDALFEARMTGVRRVRDADGVEIEYRSDNEMKAAIAAADSEIAAAQRRQPSTIHFRTSKGLY
ncbi:hypothetical protein Rvan_2774 [Rhodomicrobium vannielii ATCC 17100]|uniref:Uncharacterized protein n=1 Tax=Rhodomicrobium vannielii (strain ATCC 17100 / DSM 162 / LMG 4299 / NCIMB 10020 / ATH 3.1.1) TaxID=648757 RepID=E3I858_RHOVT|nr:hypothetical protein [Rhodomicrobium vannielii]ADP71984.1 hypothetical protein Rvan_2774 [Rhodomicrobium vannielii ATCC 17100]